MNPLEDEAFRLARDADEALHSEDVHPALTEQLAKPGVELVGIDVALPLDCHRAHFVVVFMLGDPGSLNLDGNRLLDAQGGGLRGARRLIERTLFRADCGFIRGRQLEIELLRRVLGVEAKPQRRIDLEKERLAPRLVKLQAHMPSDGNLIPRANGVRGFGVPAHTPFRAVTKGGVIRALVGHDNEGHGRIGSIVQAEFVATDVERIDSRPFERVFRLEEGGTALEHLVQVEGTEVEHCIDGDVRPLAADDSRHAVHFPEPGLEPVERLVVNEVRLVKNKDVRERDLFRALVAAAELLLDVGCVDERDDPVQGELGANFVVHEEGLSDRTGIGEPRGLHQHIVELVSTLHEVAEHANQVSTHRAADAAVRHLENLLVSVDDERLIDADLPELVFDHGDAFAVFLLQDPVQQGRLAGAEEAGEDRNWYVLRRVHLVLLEQGCEHRNLYVESPCRADLGQVLGVNGVHGFVQLVLELRLIGPQQANHGFDGRAVFFETSQLGDRDRRVIGKAKRFAQCLLDASSLFEVRAAR